MYSSNSACCSWTSQRMLLFAFLAPLALVTILAAGGQFLGKSMANGDWDKVLRHVVQFKFQEASSPTDISKVVDAFRGLPSKISAIASFEYGVDNSPEGLANGFTHCFLITFRSEKDREVYLKHPAHQEFVDILKPHLDKVQVIDYWAGK